VPLFFIWTDFAQQVTSGLAAGAIYASLALALVLIYQTTNVVNFAQGEMATFTTFIAWMFMDHGLPYWPAFALTLLVAFAGGVAVERVLIRPIEHRPEIVIVIMTIGLLIALNGLSGWIWGPEVKAFDSPFPNKTVTVADVAISVRDIGTFCVCLGVVVLLWLFFRFTKLGLAARAAARVRGLEHLVQIVDLVLDLDLGRPRRAPVHHVGSAPRVVEPEQDQGEHQARRPPDDDDHERVHRASLRADWNSARPWTSR